MCVEVCVCGIGRVSEIRHVPDTIFRHHHDDLYAPDTIIRHCPKFGQHLTRCLGIVTKFGKHSIMFLYVAFHSFYIFSIVFSVAVYVRARW